MKLHKVLIASLTLVLTLQPLALQPLALQAQEAPEADGAPIWRRVVLGTLGATIVGGAAALGANENKGSLCGSKACIVSVATVVGLGAGYFLGRERDEAAYRHRIEGPSMDFGLRRVGLGDTPAGLAGSGGTVLAYTRSEVLVLEPDLRLRPILSEVRPRAVAVVEATGDVVVGTNDVLLRVPYGMEGDRAEGPEQLFHEGATTLETVGAQTLAVGSPGRIRLLRLDGGVGVHDEGVAETVGLPMSLKRAGNGEDVLWSVVDSVLVSRNARTLEELGRLELGGRTRELAIAGRIGIVSLGSEGAALLDLSDPGAPRMISRITGMEFAYSAAVLDGRAYVAAGPQGVFVFDVTSPSEPRSLGVERSFSFAGTLMAHDGGLYILDRERNELTWAQGLR